MDVPLPEQTIWKLLKKDQIARSNLNDYFLYYLLNELQIVDLNSVYVYSICISLNCVSWYHFTIIFKVSSFVEVLGSIPYLHIIYVVSALLPYPINSKKKNTSHN